MTFSGLVFLFILSVYLSVSLPVSSLLPGSFLLIFPSVKTKNKSEHQKHHLKCYQCFWQVFPDESPHWNTFLSRCPHDDCHSPIQLPRMVEKIFFLLASSISAKERKLKWRVKRWVMGFLPPPGGPMAHAKFMSTRFLNVPVKRRGWIRVCTKYICTLSFRNAA